MSEQAHGVDGGERGRGAVVRFRDAAQIRADMAVSRRQIASAVSALRDEARRALSWRAWFRRSPLTFLGVAVAVGFLAAGGRRR